MRKLVVAVVLAAVMFGGMGTGVAFADHGDDGNTPWAGASGTGGLADAILGGVGVAPIGSHVGDKPAFANAFGSGDVNNPAVIGTANNPNCPAHYPSP